MSEGLLDVTTDITLTSEQTTNDRVVEKRPHRLDQWLRNINFSLGRLDEQASGPLKIVENVGIIHANTRGVTIAGVSAVLAERYQCYEAIRLTNEEDRFITDGDMLLAANNAQIDAINTGIEVLNGKRFTDPNSDSLETIIQRPRTDDLSVIVSEKKGGYYVGRQHGNVRKKKAGLDFVVNSGIADNGNNTVLTSIDENGKPGDFTQILVDSRNGRRYVVGEGLQRMYATEKEYFEMKFKQTHNRRWNARAKKAGRRAKIMEAINGILVGLKDSGRVFYNEELQTYTI
jgi:hypothetical protein